jgi:hypothetical protein
MTTDDFDWRTDESVIVREQRSIAVYPTVRDAVAIRCERGWDEDEDVVVVVQPEHVTVLCEALQLAAREAIENARSVSITQKAERPSPSPSPPPPPARTKPKPKSEIVSGLANGNGTLPLQPLILPTDTLDGQPAPNLVA